MHFICSVSSVLIRTCCFVEIRTAQSFSFNQGGTAEKLMFQKAAYVSQATNAKNFEHLLTFYEWMNE